MTSKRMALAITSALLLGACGGVARSDVGVAQPEPTVATLSTPASGSAQTPDEPSMTMPARQQPVESTGRPESTTTTASTTSTTSTTAAVVGSTSTVTSPTETFDLSEVHNALDGLDGLFGALDGHIGSIDLNEGETP